jgi:hypothetical protein
MLKVIKAFVERVERVLPRVKDRFELAGGE